VPVDEPVKEPVEPVPVRSGDDEEDSPLVQRLQKLEWPSPPPEVKERCLAEIMERVEQPPVRE
jgi:hypothetical protein